MTEEDKIMSPSGDKKTEIKVGNIQSVISNVGGEQKFGGEVKLILDRVNQNIGAIANADQAAKDELARLTSQLYDVLQQVPENLLSEGEKVSKRLDILIQQLSDPKPDREMVEITGESLKKAAANLQGVMPAVLAIATQIVTHVLTFVH
jgi:hypothetical protein